MADMREKLIEIIREAKKQYAKNVVFSHLEEIIDMPTEEEYIAMCLEKEVILPPCKVGDKVWFIDRDLIFESVVDEILIDKQQIGVVIKSEFLNCRRGFYLNQFGKTVFLTKEEAQKVLEGRNK